MKLKILLLSLLSFSLFSGCIAVKTSGSAKRTSILPAGAQLVGGGLQIEWTAPSDGTGILIERSSGKTISTQSLQSGDSFDFSAANPDHAAVLKILFGHSLAPNAQFQLYFIPSH